MNAHIKYLRTGIIFLIIFAWIFSGRPQIWQNLRIPPEIREARAINIATPAADNACAIAFSDFDFNNHNGFIYNLDKPDHPIAISNNLDAANNLCAAIKYFDQDINSMRTVGEFSLCTPQCFGNNGTPLTNLPPGHYSFVEYGYDFDACIGSGAGVSYESCKNSSNFISETLFDITNPNVLGTP